MMTSGDNPTAAELFSKEQIKLVKHLISQQQPQTVGTGFTEHSRNFLMALNAKQSLHKTWIVDSGASDHMARDLSMFHTYTPCYKNLNIRIADGTLSKVAGFGSVTINRGADSYFSVTCP
ncbi:hypothetical protein ACOSQ3_027135 [Xanthoceras sorbifolium]